MRSKASMPSSLARQALDRDDRCIFSGVSSTDTFAVIWIFPPFEGFTVNVHYFISIEQSFFDCPSNSCLMIRRLNGPIGMNLIQLI